MSSLCWCIFWHYLVNSILGSTRMPRSINRVLSLSAYGLHNNTYYHTKSVRSFSTLSSKYYEMQYVINYIIVLYTRHRDDYRSLYTVACVWRPVVLWFIFLYVYIFLLFVIRICVWTYTISDYVSTFHRVGRNLQLYILDRHNNNKTKNTYSFFRFPFRFFFRAAVFETVYIPG